MYICLFNSLVIFLYYVLEPTVIVVTREVFSVDEEVVILVKLPELAIDHVEVLVAEEVSHLVDIVLVLQEPQRGEELGAAQLRDGDLAGPGAVHLVEYPGYHLHNQSVLLAKLVRR